MHRAFNGGTRVLSVYSAHINSQGRQSLWCMLHSLQCSHSCGVTHSGTTRVRPENYGSESLRRLSWNLTGIGHLSNLDPASPRLQPMSLQTCQKSMVCTGYARRQPMFFDTAAEPPCAVMAFSRSDRWIARTWTRVGITPVPPKQRSSSAASTLKSSTMSARRGRSTCCLRKAALVYCPAHTIHIITSWLKCAVMARPSERCDYQS